MSDIVNYVSSTLARGIHQNAFAATCDDTQTPAGPGPPLSHRGPAGSGADAEPTAPLPAPGGAANLALALAMAMVLTEAARQAKQQGNPSCLALTAATATSSPKADAVPITADACKRDGAARGAATGGKAGASFFASFAAQGRGDRLDFSVELSGKTAGKHLASVFVGEGRRGPSAGTGRPAASYSLRPGGQAWQSGGLHAWWPTLALPDGEIHCTPHLTGSGRLLMARKRLLLLRCGGHVVRRGWLR